jgi:phage replication O-like protein O
MSQAQRRPEADYRALVKTVREDLLRFDLSKQHLKVLFWVLELSYGWGNEAVKIPKLGVLRQLTGLSVAHLSTTVKELQQMRILVVSSVEGAVEYKVQPDCDKWHCRPLATRGDLRHAMDWLRVYNLGDAGAKVIDAFVPVNLDYPPEATEE